MTAAFHYLRLAGLSPPFNCRQIPPHFAENNLAQTLKGFLAHNIHFDSLAMPSNSSSISSSRQMKETNHGGGGLSHSFVFGSSTPRELSHINHPKVTRRERYIETKLKPKPLPNGERRGIVYYMRQARSIDRRGTEERGISKNYAFGSSTPRSLSHLSNLARAQRVYDSKLEKTPEISGIRSITNPHLADSRGRSLSRDSRPDEDALSEPDLVQDRQREYAIGGNKKTKLVKEEESTKPSKTKEQQQSGGQHLETLPNEIHKGEMEERAKELEMNHRAVSSEVVKEDDEEGNRNQHLGMAGLKVRTPEDIQTERANPVRQNDEPIQRDGLSPVSDF